MAARTPKAGADPNPNAADPTRQAPDLPDDAGPDARAIAGQQHTGNHGKPAGENTDRTGGTRAGAENVEPTDKSPGSKDRDRAGG